MSRNYDNWERLVAAVLKRELIWKLCHQHSRTPSLISPISSDFGSSFNFSSSFSRPSFDFTDPKDDFFRFANSALSFRYLLRITGAYPETNGLVDEAGQLVHFEGSPFSFGRQELLDSPSYILGDDIETFRNTYVVRPIEGATFVVKRLGRCGSTQEKLERKAKATGTIKHENVVRMRGCYLSQDMNLGFFDYCPEGCVYTMLHGKKRRESSTSRLDSTQKSSNWCSKRPCSFPQKVQWDVSWARKVFQYFLNSQQYGCICIGPSAARFSNYDPPGVLLGIEKPSRASDVYSFGVVLIELVSGRSPLCSQKTFVDWAIHNVRDECTAMVFDKGLLKDPVGMQGMWDTLAVALSCVKKKSQERPNMDGVVEMLESIT